MKQVWRQGTDRKEDSREETVQEGVRAPGDGGYHPEGVWSLAEGAGDTVTLVAHTGAWGKTREGSLLRLGVWDPRSCSLSVLSLAMESTRNLTNVSPAF